MKIRIKAEDKNGASRILSLKDSKKIANKLVKTEIALEALKAGISFLYKDMKFTLIEIE